MVPAQRLAIFDTLKRAGTGELLDIGMLIGAHSKRGVPSGGTVASGP